MKGVRVNDLAEELSNPCPVCGKQPKVYRDYAYEDAGFGAWCTIECKPFLRKPHIKVECGKSTWKRALIGAFNMWNARTEGVNDGN